MLKLVYFRHFDKINLFEKGENMETNNTIIKPITVAQTELAEKIINDINEMGLHPSLIMPVIDEIYSIMKNTMAETKERERAAYEKAIKEVAEKNDNDESK